MIKVTPVHRKIIEVAREFDESSCGANLIQLLERIKGSSQPNPQFYNKLCKDPLLLESAKSLGVEPGSEYTFFDFLSAVAKAQLHVKREEREYSYFHQAIIENYPTKSRGNVRKIFLEIAADLGTSEINFINFIIDTLDEVKSYKSNFMAFYSAPDVPGFLNDKLKIDRQITSGSNGFVLLKESSDYEKCIELFKLATH